MPDGGIVKEDFPHIANTLAKLIAEQAIPPMILVGIENINRKLDLTGPTTFSQDLEWVPINGGSQNFRLFIEQELMPEIESRYRVNEQRSIVGESLAGLFVVETFLLQPDLFDCYVAMDPSLWWNGQKLTREAATSLESLPEKPIKFWFAGSGASDIHIHCETLAQTLKEHAPENLQWKYTEMPEEQHNTIFRASKEAAFKWAWADETVPH